MEQGLAIIDEAVIVAKALEDFRVDEARRTEPATVKVNVGDVAVATRARVGDLNCVCGNATWQWCRRRLAYLNVTLAALLNPFGIRYCTPCINNVNAIYKLMKYVCMF